MTRSIIWEKNKTKFNESKRGGIREMMGTVDTQQQSNAQNNEKRSRGYENETLDSKEYEIIQKQLGTSTADLSNQVLYLRKRTS